MANIIIHILFLYNVTVHMCINEYNEYKSTCIAFIILYCIYRCIYYKC